MEKAVGSLSAQLDRLEKQGGSTASADISGIQRLLTEIRNAMEPVGKE